MTERLALRALAVMSALLAGTIVWSLAAAGHQDWKQVAAKACFAAVLLWTARLAWRRPAGGAERTRRRVLRLMAVLAWPDLQREWAESSPATDLAEALLADWRRAVASPADLAAAFAPDELELVVSLTSDLEAMASRLPRPPGAAQAPAWADITRRAALTHQTFITRAGENGVGIRLFRPGAK